MIATIGILLLSFLGSYIFGKIEAARSAKELQTKDVALQEVTNEPPPPPPPPPPKLPPPPPVATIQFTPPKVVKDQEVIKPPPEIKQIEEAKIDVKTEEGTKDVGIVAPPTEEKGTQVVAEVKKEDDEDKVFTKVEIEAQFPGGPDAWQKYVTRAISSESDEFTESDYGTCHIRFIVDKTGKVSDVEAMDMKGSKLAEIAVNAIRKGPNWTPAQQNGRYVNAYRIQPVTVVAPDQ